jgi:hypothetical protein
MATRSSSSATGVGNAAVASDRFDQRAQAQRWSPQQQCFNTPVLVAKLNLQMVHLLAMAHEAEVPGLDHAGVDGADTDLVDLLPAHREERVVGHVLLARAFETHRLQPGVPDRLQACLFPHFAFEHLGGRVSRGQRGECVAISPTAAQYVESASTGLVTQHHRRGDHAVVFIGPPEQCQQAFASGHGLSACSGPGVQAHRRQFLGQCHHDGLGWPHHRPPIDCATATSSALIGAGV